MQFFVVLALLYVCALTAAHQLAASTATVGIVGRRGRLPAGLRHCLQLRGGSKVNHVESVAAFDKALAAAGDKLVVVDFTATWCGPCKMIAPVYDELSDEYANVVFLKVDVDELPEITARYSVMSMPTFLFLKKAQVTSRFSGASVEKLRSTIQELV